jgi:Ferritin-like domain
LESDRSAVAVDGDDEGGADRSALVELIGDHTSRRRFLRALGGTAGASALAAVASACGRQKPLGITQRKPGNVSNFGAGDSGIVNYALFLEYIEGDFYDRALRGDELRGRAREIFRQVRQNEAEHRNVLDRIADQVSRPIRQPRTDFDEIFSGGPQRIVAFAGMLENVGSAAYLGQLRFVADRPLLAAMLSIHSVEARQAAALNELAGRGYQTGRRLYGSIPTGPFARPMTMEQTLKVVRPYYVGGIPSLRPPVS